MYRFGFCLFCGASAHQRSQNLVLDALYTACLGQGFGIQCDAKALVDLDGELDGHDGGQPHITQYGRYAKVLGIDDLCDDGVDFLLQHIHGHIALLYELGGLLLGFGKGFLVDFLVLVERNAVYLHGDGRYHVRWFLVEYETVEGIDVYLLVADDVGSEELAAIIIVESLNGDVLDAGELADYGLDFGKLDAESAYLHLSVTASHKLDIAVRQVAYDVSGAVAASPGCLDERFCCLLWTVQITSTYLRTIDPQFASCAYG